jgi:predicted ester cyclase
VQVNDQPSDPRAYGAGLRSVIDRFPDFTWTLEQLLVDGGYLSARLTDTGTTPSGQRFALREFAMYRIEDSRIAAVWGDLDPERFPG